MESVILEIFDKYATEINVKSKIKVCRDKKDNFLLSLAIDGNADYLITGDKDLFDLVKFQNTNIVTLSDFIKINNI
jgi:putative PIN family toxin of toxin-antitoxin system